MDHFDSLTNAAAFRSTGGKRAVWTYQDVYKCAEAVWRTLPKEAKAVIASAEWKGTTLLKVRYAEPTVDPVTQKEAPCMMWSTGAEALHVNLVWLSPVLSELPPIRASAHFVCRRFATCLQNAPEQTDFPRHEHGDF